MSAEDRETGDREMEDLLTEGQVQGAAGSGERGITLVCLPDLKELGFFGPFSSYLWLIAAVDSV